MSKFKIEEKLKIVKEHEKGYGPKYLSDKYNISIETIKTWCEKYKLFGIKGIEKSMKNNNYSLDFKLHVLKYRLENGLSYNETAKIFGIINSSSICLWQKKFDEKGVEGLSGNRGRPKKYGDELYMSKDKKINPNLNESEKEELKRLRIENMYLKAEIEYKKKLEALILEEERIKKRQR